MSSEALLAYEHQDSLAHAANQYKVIWAKNKAKHKANHKAKNKSHENYDINEQEIKNIIKNKVKNKAIQASLRPLGDKLNNINEPNSIEDQEEQEILNIIKNKDKNKAILASRRPLDDKLNNNDENKKEQRGSATQESLNVDINPNDDKLTAALRRKKIINKFLNNANNIKLINQNHKVAPFHNELTENSEQHVYDYYKKQMKMLRGNKTDYDKGNNGQYDIDDTSILSNDPISIDKYDGNVVSLYKSALKGKELAYRINGNKSSDLSVYFESAI